MKRLFPAPETVIEVDLGPDDVLLLETADGLSTEVCNRLKTMVEDVLKKPGRQSIVLTDGLTARVIHRKPL